MSPEIIIGALATAVVAEAVYIVKLHAQARTDWARAVKLAEKLAGDES